MKTISHPFFVYFSVVFLLLFACTETKKNTSDHLIINDNEYFEMPGLNVMVYHDYYPNGRQGGITIIQNGERVAANGDIRLITQPRFNPSNGPRVIDQTKNEISLSVGYPDSVRQQYKDPRYTYPDISLMGTVRVSAEGKSFRISVDLDQPLEAQWIGKAVFSMELFPGHFFDKSFYMDDQPGIFPRQANGPMLNTSDGQVLKPLAVGNKLVALPDSEYDRFTIESMTNDLVLVDNRGTNKAGWFSVHSVLSSDATKNVVEWLITPITKSNYQYEPVIQVSQVGYRPNQEKVAIIEMDSRTIHPSEVELMRISENGGLKSIKKIKPEKWGNFLRYTYAKFDFSEIKQEGMYKLKIENTVSDPFMISDEVYKRHVWQPTLEYYLPVQMCHMRINELVKVWHGLCHEDDALMAPVNHVHFDGYRQGSSTLCKYSPFDAVPGLNVGGWHDAGDYDLRVESQANTVRTLSWMWELFDTDYDLTSIDQQKKLVEIHQPDGKPDMLQQIEHGVLTIIGGYKALGRLYRGIIVPTGRQYSLLGDGSTMTDNLIYNSSLDSTERTATHSGIRDDRWVFTEENPRRELDVAACLATAYRSLKGYNDGLANDCLATSKALWEQHKNSGHAGLIDPAVELYLSTGDKNYYDFILENKKLVLENLRITGPPMARLVPKITDEVFLEDLRNALQKYADEVAEVVNESPYGVRYNPNIWGDGWNIQRFGVAQYFLHKGFPEIFTADPVYNSLNFILGVHPGSNTSSFVSGVGARSVLVAYGVNRDDWSFIPGGSVSGTALIRPDFPEMKIWPYLWQQTEYVMGGGATHFMFLVLASDMLLDNQ